MGIGLLTGCGSQIRTGVSVEAINSATYDYLIGTGILCALDPSACPAIAQAPNGDTLELTGSGTLSVYPKSVSGGGTFVHLVGGVVAGSGTWSATKLESFVSYGCGEEGLPENICGGRAIIRVVLDPADPGVPNLEGMLQIDCLVGDKIPAGAIEGVRLAIMGIGLNFNKEVSGFTVFILD